MEMLFSVKESAKKLGGISPWTIYSWLSQGKIQRVKIGSRTMIAESELLRVIREGAKTTAPVPSEQFESAGQSEECEKSSCGHAE